MPCAATLDFEAAQAILAAHAQPLGVERVGLAKAGRRTLAAPLQAGIDIPRYDTAAMDGFAVRETDLIAGVRHFALLGAAYPGEPWTTAIGHGQAVRIMTGAHMPVGADRVLMREVVSVSDSAIAVMGVIPAKLHVRPLGSDSMAGSVLLPAGRTLDPRAMVVAAAADVAELTVFERPKLRVITTGDEVVAPGEASAGSGIPDSLSDAVLLMARQWGGVPLGKVAVRDDPDALSAAAATALNEADVLVIIGGASRGDRDFAKQALAPLGLDLAFADLAIKPGKPVWFGRIGPRYVVGLPGNPTAAMTVARLFLAPLLTALGGRGTAAALHWETGPLTEGIGANGERESFLCAERLENGVRQLERQSASAQSMLANADVLIRRAGGAPAQAAGAPVQFVRF